MTIINIISRLNSAIFAAAVTFCTLCCSLLSAEATPQNVNADNFKVIESIKNKTSFHKNSVSKKSLPEKEIATAARNGVPVEAVIASVHSVIKTQTVPTDQQTIKEAAIDVAKDTTGGAIAGAGATAAAAVTGSALTAGLTAVGAGATVVATAQVIIPTAVAIGTVVGISYVYDKICDKVKEKMEEKEQNQKKSTANPKILTEKRPDKQ